LHAGAAAANNPSPRGALSPPPASPAQQQQAQIHPSTSSHSASSLSYFHPQSSSTPTLSDSLNVYDMTHALNEWRNIQPIVRSTFVSLVEHINKQQHELKMMTQHIRKQDEIIKEHERMLNSKATRAEVTLEVGRNLKEIQSNIESRASMVDIMSMLEQKANKEHVEKSLSLKANLSDLKQCESDKANQAEVNEYFDVHTRDIIDIKNLLTKKANTMEVVKELQKKANVTDVQQALETKANVHDVQEALKHKANKQSVISALSKKVGKSDVDSSLTQLKQTLQQELAQALSTKLDSEHLSGIQTDISHLQHASQQIRTHLDQKANLNNVQSMLAQKVSKEDFDSQLESLTNNLTPKTELEDLSHTLNQELEQIQSTLQTKIDEPRLLRVIQIVKSVKAQVELKANTDHVKEALNTKANSTVVEKMHQQLEQKPDRHEIEDIIQIKANAADLESVRRDMTSRVTKEAMGAALKKKVNVHELNNLIEQYTDVDRMKKELLLKANIKDVMALLEEKADSGDLDRTSDQVNNLMAQKVHIDQYSQALQDQAIINEALLAQNNMARWVWKSGKLKSGHGVPWNVQVLNTAPENYLWEKDRVNIIVVQPGLYEVAFGFYGKKQPTIQLHVNGEPILSAGVNGPSNVVYNKASKRLRQKAGAVTGLTHIDFLAIPEKARIAISCAGEKGEGFVSMRKL